MKSRNQSEKVSKTTEVTVEKEEEEKVVVDVSTDELIEDK